MKEFIINFRFDFLNQKPFNLSLIFTLKEDLVEGFTTEFKNYKFQNWIK